MAQSPSAFLIELTAPTISRPLSSFTHDAAGTKQRNFPFSGMKGKQKTKTLFNTPADQNVADKYEEPPISHVFMHPHSQDTKIMEEPAEVPMQM